MVITHMTEGPNFYRVDLGRLIVWFSYETPIAFQVGGKRFISENVWTKTTGKHLNKLDDGTVSAKSLRLSHDTFADSLRKILDRLSMSDETETRPDRRTGRQA